MGEARRRRKAEAVHAPTLPQVRSARIAIIEWLAEDERRTGAELKVRLERRPGHALPIELYPCRTKQDVFDALASITRSVPMKGTPILHIEAHGSVEYTGFIGPSSEELTWEELGDPLRVLNTATRFNLVVVAAACLSEAILFAVQMPKPIPYLAAVCFRTEVVPGRLLDSMLELYRALVIDGRSLQEAAERADRELSGSELLRFTSVPLLMRNAAAYVMDDLGACNFDNYYASMAAKVQIRTGRPLQYTPAAFKKVMRDAAIEAVESALRLSLDYEHFPENRLRFGFDPKQFVDDMLRAELRTR